MGPTPDPQTVERRSHPRKRLDQLAYIGFGPDTGGVLLDISEEGLRCQIVGAVVEGDRCRLKFALPGRSSAIEVNGEVVWSNNSKQGGGVHLLGLGSDVRQDLRQWIDEALASREAKKPASPAGVRARKAGAAHAPKPGTSEVAGAQPAAEKEIETQAAAPQPLAPEKPASPPAEVHTPIKPAFETVAEALGSSVATRRTVAAAVQEPAMKPRERNPVRPLSVSHVEKWNLPFLRVAVLAVLAGCALAGLAALAFSGFDPRMLSEFSKVFSDAQTHADLGTGKAAPLVPPLANDLASPTTEAQPEEISQPNITNNNNTAVADLPLSANQDIRPKAPAVNNPPAKTPANVMPAKPANRQRLPLVLSRPHATASAPRASAVPEAFVAPSLPAAPLMDMPALRSPTLEAPKPVRPQASAAYQEPRLLVRVEPVYSNVARQMRLQGTVGVSATIGTNGLLHSVECTGGNAVLCRIAVEAVAKWRYQPATSDGQPVEAPALINFNFELR
jgi:protein TonB